ncbi:dUTP diphosphatase [Bacillus sp. 1P06AnD]|uniref:dUTP diphosphatase n=1 Tax=Bacillus sp. 1P06AnD TaxID=3132208 RepID=UPI0039A18329
MNTEQLFRMQKEFDQHVQQHRQLQGEPLMDMKFLALLVELGELANATRCFKYWSATEPESKQRILKEYADGIQSILSLGIEFGFDSRKYVDGSYYSGEKELTSQFLHVFEAVHLFKVKRSFDMYKILFYKYLHLGMLLGFSSKDIEETYTSRNEMLS